MRKLKKKWGSIKNDKTILITGDAGFVGRHCVGHLLRNTDLKIVVLDVLNYAGDIKKVKDNNFFATARARFI